MSGNTYHGLGRLVCVANIPEKGCQVDFQYDSHGRKIATQTFAPETLERFKGGVCTDGSLWNAAVAGIGVPVGGKIVTNYDENGLPTESQILNADAQVVRRFVRTGNAYGRIIEEEWVWENPMLNFLDGIPAEQRAQLSPQQVQEANAALANIFLRNQEGMSYTYDAHGCLTSTLLRFNVLDMRTEFTYNEKGDQATKQRKLSPNSARVSDFQSRIEKSGFDSPSTSGESPGPAPFSRGLPDESFIENYTYQYDSHGNWTQKSVTASGHANESVIVCNRKLAYY